MNNFKANYERLIIELIAKEFDENDAASLTKNWVTDNLFIHNVGIKKAHIEEVWNRLVASGIIERFGASDEYIFVPLVRGRQFEVEIPGLDKSDGPTTLISDDDGGYPYFDLSEHGAMPDMYEEWFENWVINQIEKELSE